MVGQRTVYPFLHKKRGFDSRRRRHPFPRRVRLEAEGASLSSWYGLVPRRGFESRTRLQAYSYKDIRSSLDDSAYSGIIG